MQDIPELSLTTQIVFPEQVVAVHGFVNASVHPNSVSVPIPVAGTNPDWQMQVAPLSVFTHCKLAPILFAVLSAQVVDEQLATHPPPVMA